MDLLSNHKVTENNTLFSQKVLVGTVDSEYDMHLPKNIKYLIALQKNCFISESDNLLYLFMPYENDCRKFKYLLYLYCKYDWNIDACKYLIYVNHMPNCLLKYLVYLINFNHYSTDPNHKIFDNENIINIHYMITHIPGYLYYPNGILVLNSYKRHKILLI